MCAIENARSISCSEMHRRASKPRSWQKVEALAQLTLIKPRAVSMISLHARAVTIAHLVRGTGGHPNALIVGETIERIHCTPPKLKVGEERV